MPFAFTEHGALMAGSVLNTPRAVEVSLYVVRAFVELREALATNKELAKRLDELESRLERKLATHDQAIAGILEAIRQLMAPPEPTKKRRMGLCKATNPTLCPQSFSSQPKATWHHEAPEAVYDSVERRG